MSAFWYGVALQWKIDIRSKSMLITCYLVPLVFFFFMGGIFTSINPEARETLIQSMTVFGVSMGALMGLPPPLAELYGSEIQKAYRANGVPLYLGVVTNFLSAFFHLLMMSVILFLIAPITFDATVPQNIPGYFGMLALFTAASLCIGCVLGLLVKNVSKLAMVAMIFFLPSIMLSGIMFPAAMLPEALASVGKIFPAYWGFVSTTSGEITFAQYGTIILIAAVAIAICMVLLRRKARQ